MTDFKFNQEEYLERIKLNGAISTDFESLKSIHQAQHRAIPFENFDICLGKEIKLEPNDLAQKLIKNKRGGYCFELNGLLVLALKSFGFNARELLGRVHVTGKPTGRGHQITLVTIKEKKWIVDLGFGSESPPFPIPLVYNESITFQGRTFRLVADDLYGIMLQRKHEKDWKNLYSFDLKHVCTGDIDYGNHFTSTSSNSFFTFARVAVLPVENGMITLYNSNLKKTIDGIEENIQLKEDQSYLNVIEQEFGIALKAKYEDLKPIN